MHAIPDHEASIHIMTTPPQPLTTTCDILLNRSLTVRGIASLNGDAPGITMQEWIGQSMADLVVPGDLARIQTAIVCVMDTPDETPVVNIRFRAGAAQAWFTGTMHLPVNPTDDDAFILRLTAADADPRAAAPLRFDHYSQLIEMISRGASLEELVASITEQVETFLDGAICSVMLLKEDGRHLERLTFRGLPEAFIEKVESLLLGPGVGTCGEAIFTRRTVFVTDTMTDPLWMIARDEAEEFDLRACWSSPILDRANDRVFGTFAIYFHAQRTPVRAEQRVIEHLAELTGIAIRMHAANAARQQMEERMRRLVQFASDIILQIDEDQIITYTNPSAEPIFGMPIDQLIGTHVGEYVHPDDRHISLGMLAELQTRTSQDAPVERELRVVHPDGTAHWLDVRGMNLFDSPAIKGILLNARIITERKEAEVRQTELYLREMTARASSDLAQQRFQDLVHGLDAIVWELDMTTRRYTFVSQRAETMLGYSVDRWMKERGFWESHIHPDDRARVLTHWNGTVEKKLGHEIEYRMITAHNETIWIRDIAVARLVNGFPRQYRGIMIDITETKKAEQELRRMALTDTLTNLPNRTLFLDRLEHARHQGTRHNEELAVLFLDIDHFKEINDTYGHATGDAVLVAVAQRLRQCIRKPDTLARLSGDEFTILLEGVRDARRAAISAAERIIDAFATPLWIDNREIPVKPSVGIATTIGDYDANELLRQADVALYSAKTAGRGRLAVFEPSMNIVPSTMEQRGRDLGDAIAQKQLVVQYEPLVSLETGEISGFEALVRWNHPNRGWVVPADFIPNAEETGLIVPLGEYVLRTACRQLVAWQEEFPERRDLGISVNVSARQIRHPGFVSSVLAIVEETGITPQHLRLEVTESVAMVHPETAAEILIALQERGISLVLDDFGTGYSGLGAVQRFPLGGLKIARQFVDVIDQDLPAMAVIRAVMGLAHELRLDVTGEGIETPQQLALLSDLGCNRGQGYIFGRSRNAEQVTPLLALPRPFADIVQAAKTIRTTVAA